MTQDEPQAWMTEEALDHAISELLDLAATRGNELRELQGRSAPDMPRIEERLRNDLRRSLTEEIVPASRGRNGEIDAHEVEHEVIKKALIGMRLPALREAARDEGLPTSGAAEQVATRVAQAHGWNPEEVARLVLRYEEEPTAERGHVTRLFPLRDNVEIKYALTRLTVVAGRYIRVGVARWFVFEEVKQASEARLEISGSYRAYRATVDESAGQPSLTPVPGREPVRVTLGGSDVLQVHGGGVQAARAAAHALAIVIRTPLRGYVPNAEAGATALTGSVHPTSEFMLDVLSSRLGDLGFYNRNLTVARFKVGESEDDESGEQEGTRPKLRAVRFEGQHILDSIAACRLLATERRPLPEIALQAFFQPDDIDKPTRLPIKIGIERDHVLAATGLGTEPLVSSSAHQRVLTALKEEMELGVSDTEKLRELIHRVNARAEEAAPPEAATMLPDSN
ncbi:hypothetical protein [Modestobacter sp. URMC 112]